MTDQSQLSEQQVLTKALAELGVSSEDSDKIIKELQMQTGKLVMVELLSRLTEEDFAILREQLAGKDTDSKARVITAYLEQRFTIEERRQAAKAALQKVTPELQNQLSQKTAGIELDEAGKMKLQSVMAKLSSLLASESS